jgi:dihydroorotase-like cyclic amidohydrolase
MLFERAAAAASGSDNLRVWAATRPPFAEGAQAFAAGLVGLNLGVPFAFVHVSAPETLDAIRYLRAQGARVHGETAPQYLSVSPSDELGLIGKQMPPLRDEAYQAALWKACADGTITMIGSDHQIARREDKEDPGWWGQPSERAGSGGGLTGSIAPIMLSEGVNRNRITLEQFVKLTSENIAHAYAIYPRKGALAPGSDADMIVVDIDRTWTMSVDSLKCSSDYCLWEGREVRGRVVKTLLRGRLIAEEGEMLAEASDGRYVY